MPMPGKTKLGVAKWSVYFEGTPSEKMAPGGDLNERNGVHFNLVPCRKLGKAGCARHRAGSSLSVLQEPDHAPPNSSNRATPGGENLVVLRIVFRTDMVTQKALEVFKPRNKESHFQNGPRIPPLL